MSIKKPPYSEGAEMAVLASMIEDNECIEKVRFLHADDFYIRSHQMIFELILSERDKGKPADLDMLFSKVTDEMGGIAYLADICKSNGSTRNVVGYANEVLDLSIRRKSILTLNQCCEQLYDPSTDYIQSLAESEDNVNKQISRKSDGDVLTIDDLIGESVDKMEFTMSEVRSGISTGIEEIDERLGDSYLALGEITVLGALSKNGKTLFANTIAARMRLNDDEVAHIFSIEMPSVGMFNAIVSARTGVPANFYRKQSWYLEKYPSEFDIWMAKWGTAATELRDSRKFSIDGTKEVDADYICSQMRKQDALAKNAGKKLRVVIIDHLHRMNFHNGNNAMTYAIRDAVRKIKNTASTLGIAVILLAQLNNRAEGQDPTSFHILDSSAVRHELQAFIGTRIFRENGRTFFGVYADSQRYADSDTKMHPAYMILVGGVLRSLPKELENWTPTKTED